jgi:hypothetical protein
MPGQRRAREVVEAPRAGLAPVALPVGLPVVEPVPDHAGAAAGGTADPLRSPRHLRITPEAFQACYPSTPPTTLDPDKSHG